MGRLSFETPDSVQPTRYGHKVHESLADHEGEPARTHPRGICFVPAVQDSWFGREQDPSRKRAAKTYPLVMHVDPPWKRQDELLAGSGKGHAASEKAVFVHIVPKTGTTFSKDKIGRVDDTEMFVDHCGVRDDKEGGLMGEMVEAGRNFVGKPDVILVAEKDIVALRCFNGGFKGSDNP